MAKNLLDAGHKVLVHDVFPEAVVDLRELGAGTANTPSEVASKTSTIVTMLPSRYVSVARELNNAQFIHGYVVKWTGDDNQEISHSKKFPWELKL